MYDMLKTCRCCLNEFKFDQDLYEFSSELSLDGQERDSQQFQKISTCFATLTSIEIPEKEQDQNKICHNCLGDLKSSYLFQQKCWESDEKYQATFEDKQEVNPEVNEVNTEYVEEEYISEIADESCEIFDEDTEEYPEEELLQATAVKIESSSHRHFATIARTKSTKPDEGKIPRLALKSKVIEKREEALELHECSLCHKVSVSKEEHEDHMRANHDVIQTEYLCSRCQSKFDSTEELEAHNKRFHTNADKPFTCEECCKCFKNRYQLVLHIRSHTGEKPFQCTVCNRCFSMSSNLQKHIDTHSSNKPFECEVCHQFFKTMRSLKFHTICYHQPEAKVKCPQCDKTFVNKSYLKMHMVYHRGEKNYTCGLCHSKYFKTSHLKRHIQNVHFKNRPMKCEFCTSDFVRKETYRSHVISHHKRHLSDEEFEDVLERIKKFQSPVMENINQYVLGKNDTFLDEGTMNEEQFEVIETEEQSEDEEETDSKEEENPQPARKKLRA